MRANCLLRRVMNWWWKILTTPKILSSRSYNHNLSSFNFLFPFLLHFTYSLICRLSNWSQWEKRTEYLIKNNLEQFSLYFIFFSFTRPFSLIYNFFPSSLDYSLWFFGMKRKKLFRRRKIQVSTVSRLLDVWWNLTKKVWLVRLFGRLERLWAGGSYNILIHRHGDKWVLCKSFAKFVWHEWICARWQRSNARKKR